MNSSQYISVWGTWTCIVVQWGNWHIPFVPPSFSSPSSIFMARTSFVLSIPLNITSFCYFFLHLLLFCPLPAAGLFFVLRADINECERLPQPCAHQCINTPGSFKCTCPPGRHLLGDGKSCAGLERLPSYESYSFGYRTSQSSPERNSYQRLYHNLASQSYHSYAATTRGRNRSRSRRETPVDSSQRGFLACQQGFESRGGSCLGNNGGQAGLRWGRGCS